MIIWNKPGELPKEGIELIIRYKGADNKQYSAVAYFDGSDYVNYYGCAIDNVLAWTEYNMPEWVEREVDADQ